MFKHVVFLSCLMLLTGVCSVVSAVTIVDDPVEPGSGWTATNGFGDGFGLTTPIEGANLINLADFSADPASITYSNLLQAGTYTTTFWVHNYGNNPSPPPGLTAHLQAGGIDLDDVLTSALTPTPAAGAWVQWTLEHEIPFGDSRIGTPLGFLITDIAGPGNGAFDSLDIDFVAAPEPAAIALWTLLGVAGTVFFLRRRR